MCLCNPVGLYRINCLNSAVSSASVQGSLISDCCAASDAEGLGEGMADVDRPRRDAVDGGGDEVAAVDRRARLRGAMMLSIQLMKGVRSRAIVS